MHAQECKWYVREGGLPCLLERAAMVEMHHKSLTNMWASFHLDLRGYGEEGDELEAKEIVLKKKLSMKAWELTSHSRKWD